MATKSKQTKIDPKQTLLSFGKSTDVNNNIEKHVDSPTIQKDPQSESRKVKRNFKTQWLKTFSWLRYENHSMYCQICTDAGKKNAMTKSAKNDNFQNSTLTRHAGLPEHKMLIEAPKHKADLKAVMEKHSSKQDTAVKVLLKCVHWLSTEDLPFLKYKSLLNFLHSLTVEDIESISILKNSEIQYDSSTTCSELLDSISSVVEDDLQRDLQNSPVVTALADESTDIANNKRLVIYAQIISNDMKPSTRFLTNVECHDASGKGIADSILQEFQKRGVGPQKILSLGSDGASVMTGKKNGCAAVMRRKNPHMYNVHCVAHRLALCTSQAAEHIPHLKNHQQILTDLFYYFKGSSKRAGRLHEIQEIVDDPVLTIKEIHSVRWLSYYNALTTVFRTIDSLLTYLAERPLSDAKASGLKKKISTDTFLSVTYMMMDAMAPVTILSQFFQTENVDVALVKVKLDLCVKDLEKMKTLDTPHLKKLTEDLPPESSEFKEHSITRSNFRLDKLVEEFTDSLVTNIKSRFPDDDILTAFSILCMRPLSFLNPTQLEDYGNDEIMSLCDYYGQPQTVTWNEDGEELQNTSQPLVNSEQTLAEWHVVKQVVKAEQYPRDIMWKLWFLINQYHGGEFPNLLILAQLALTCSVHTAGCERGFSVQNRILTTFRNRLGVDKQRKLMLVKIDGSDRDTFKFDEALLKWKQSKDRRVYELNIK